MASNPTCVGRRYAPQAVTLGAAQGAAFAAATDDPWDYAARGLLPPMALVVASIPHGVMQVAGDTELIGDPARLMRVVHGEEDIVWHAPLRAGVAWSLTPTLRAIEMRSAGEALTVHTEVADASGVVLAEASSLMLIRERQPGAPRRSAPPAPPLVAVRSVTWDVAPDQPDRYAAASGDANPIHLDDGFARMVGLRGRILHGLCTMSFAARALCAVQGCAPTELRRLRLRFARPVFPGDTLTCRLAAPTPAGQGVQVRLEIVNGEGQRVATDGYGELGPGRVR